MERRAFDIRGVVQGVGFRPFVHAMARRLNLTGFVANQGARVAIEVEGQPDALAQFEHALIAGAPPLARIESVSRRDLAVRGDASFQIVNSITRRDAAVYVSPDAATCDACLTELFDPTDRRYLYPCINCTACGPRLTIITGSPYDRAQTTMARFEMCADCRAEYQSPGDRRFHAEPIACHACGPTLAAIDAAGGDTGPAIEAAAGAIRAGRIVAVKGLGGFHLACDAGNNSAVAALRSRKHRDHKPFAVMVADLVAAEAVCEVSDDEATLLRSAARPIVLLKKKARGADSIAAAVAPDQTRLGLMLPYTPLHHLLMAMVNGRALVMTSGNLSDEPIAIDNDAARDRLRGIADLWLLHDRDIRVRCEDSVVRHAGHGPILIRRSRGWAPAPMALSFACAAPMLAVGGHLKNTFALAAARTAFVSHHNGDLDEVIALEAFERDVSLYEELLNVRPEIIAHDLHPDYASTRYALARSGITAIGVQHHHAHIASCMAEHGLDAPVIGIAWDGAGWGPDGTVWGGEFLVAERGGFERAAHFRNIAQPGGDRAAREPWRMALAHLRDAGIDDDGALAGIQPSARRVIRRMVDRGINTPMTSSVGRLFDAVAALCGAAPEMTYEGQAAMWLESLAEQSDAAGAYAFEIDDAGGAPLVIDTRPLIRGLHAHARAGIAPAIIARRFHTTLGAIAASVAHVARDRTGIDGVVLSGGVFANAILLVEVETALASAGMKVYRHQNMPPGDGGLCLGQIAVAAARIAGPKER
ncbi:MAG: carbamoyltransferase HypF [Vicinamibacterales bacterium]